MTNKANPEGMKWPTDKAKYDENFLKIFRVCKDCKMEKCPKLPNISGEEEMIRKCSCSSAYQDTKYGNGNRVHNKAKSRFGKDKIAWTCTVCGQKKE